MRYLDYAAPDGMLDGKTILITGASDGIGKALAMEASRLGAKVILHGRNTGKLESVYDAIESTGDRPTPSIAVLDLATAGTEGYQSLAESVMQEFGRLDGMVHNASILGERLSIEQCDAGEWQRVLHVNLTAAFVLTQALFPALKAAESARTIFTSSGVGRVGKPFWGAYAVSKFGTEALSQILAAENEHTHMRFNCINPGPVRTKMRLEAYPAEDRDKLKTAEDILGAYLYLLGPDGESVNGQSLDAQ